MKISLFKIISILIILSGITFSCTEPYPITSENFEELMVVDAMLTDSLEYQTVKLTKSYPLNTDVPTYVNNASVYIQDNDDQIFNFTQAEADSTYISDTPFKAEQGKSYSLHIVTEDGKEYQSTKETTPLPITIEDVYGQRAVNNNGTAGIQLSTNINPVQEGSTYCRIDYEETYKIRTQYYSRFDNVVGAIQDPRWYAACGGYTSIFYYLLLEERESDVNICYSSEEATNILLVSGANNNTITNFPVRFIEGDNVIIKERYSILVKVYSENYDSYQYYATLKKFNTEEDTFSPNQPGFINGNISTINNTNEKVIGYFNVTSVKMKRIFFDHSDYDFPQPQSPYTCETETYNYSYYCDGPDYISERRQLYNRLVLDNYQILNIEWPSMNDRDYVVAPPECSDCTFYASNIKPDFWED